MMKMRLMMAGVAAAALLFTAQACKKTEDKGTATFNVRMTDAPGDYEAVNVDIQGVEVHTNNDGWKSLTVKTGVYNLLEFTNGLDTLIATGQIPAGKVSEIRFVLGTNNSVVVDGTSYPLSTPSAQQSGLKLKIHEDLAEGVNYTIVIDFDAAKSVVETGKGSYILKPVLRTVTTAVSGAIKGVVTPAACQPALLAISGTDTFGTYADTISGKFLIRGVPAGTYQVIVDAKPGYTDTSFNGITVVNGQVTDMDTIRIR